MATDHIRFNLGNLAMISVTAILALAITMVVINFFAQKNVPGVSHLSVGGQALLGQI